MGTVYVELRKAFRFTSVQDHPSIATLDKKAPQGAKTRERTHVRHSKIHTHYNTRSRKKKTEAKIEEGLRRLAVTTSYALHTLMNYNMTALRREHTKCTVQFEE